jgi:hypothetical protein
MTEYGPLTAFIDMRAALNNGTSGPYVGAATTGSLGFANPWSISITNGGAGTQTNVYLDSGYLSLGMLSAGYMESIYNYAGGSTFSGSDFDSDYKAKQINLSWAMSGFGLQLAIEDPRDAWGGNLSSSYSTPNIVGNITMSQGNWSSKLSGGFGETNAGSGFGAQLGMTFKLDQIAPGDNLVLKGAWAQNEVATFASTTDGSTAGESAVNPLTGGSAWSFLAGLQHFWAPTLSSSFTFDYMNQGAGTSPAHTMAFFNIPIAAAPKAGFNQYSVFGNLVWAPVTNFSAGAEVGYTKSSQNTTGTWSAKVRMERDW